MDITAFDFAPATAWVWAFVKHGQNNTTSTSVALRGAAIITERKEVAWNTAR